MKKSLFRKLNSINFNKFWFCLFTFIGTIVICPVYAQPPNDVCSGAQIIPLDGSCVTGTTVDAADNWAGIVGCQSGNNHDEVWYSLLIPTL